ncbi:MAG: hypothetical protein E4H13_09450, partial [Calditrichales bacterium]
MRNAKLQLFLLAGLIILHLSPLYAQKRPVDYVDPLLGTSSSRWMLYPGPSMPFGMVKLSPDNVDKWEYNCGYEYDIESIMGFGHIHSWAMGSFLTMPITGNVHILPGTAEDPDSGYRSRFSHQKETATPGYYSVNLDDYNIFAELTATTRCGFQRYTFPKNSDGHVIFDCQIPQEDRTEFGEVLLKKISDTEIAGSMTHATGWNEYTLHFFARFNRPFDSAGGWTGDEMHRVADSIGTLEGGPIGIYVNFPVGEDSVILLKTGISFVSIDQAHLNLEMETGPYGWDFDAVHNLASETWNTLLEKILVQGGPETDRVKFYTNLYRSYCARTIFSDANGKYMDMCEKVRQLDNPQMPVYGCDAFWNTFWNLNQLWALITPDIMDSWVNSLLEIYDRGGWLPKGPGGIEYSSIMVASHEISMIVSAYQKGIRGYDRLKAYRAMREIQMNPGRPHPCGGYVGNSNLKDYMAMGFVPADSGPVSNTMEYAYDDWCVAQMAKSLGETDDYTYFMQRAQFYKNVYDPVEGYIRPKHAGGPWQQDFVPVIKAIGKEDNFGSKDYVEGNSWQYTWFVPHDVRGLINLMGEAEFNRRLDDGFSRSRPNFVSPFINHSNQPNMQAAYLFNYSGQPWRTQYWTREILDHYYGTGPVDGYPGDEDQGQMGAWFVMSALGLFEMDGGASTDPVYELSGPLFEKATIQLDSGYYPGRQLIIEAINTSKENRYIQSVSFNGQAVDNFWISHARLVSGGVLRFEMGDKPNLQWAINSILPQQDLVEPIVTTPYIKSGDKLFLQKTEIALTCDTRDATIYYSTDGSDPVEDGVRYTDPFSIEETTMLNFVAVVGKRKSLTASAEIKKAEIQQPVDPGKIEHGLRYRYYSGFFRRTGDLLDTTPQNSGITSLPILDARDREQYFGFVYNGYIQIPQEGLYTFYLESNDGSRLYIGEELLVNNDGL